MGKEELLLIFDNLDTGKTFTIRIDDPLEDLEEIQIIASMTEIVESKLFGNLVMKGAKIIETITQSMDFE